jgi:hypothetical protein
MTTDWSLRFAQPGIFPDVAFYHTGGDMGNGLRRLSVLCQEERTRSESRAAVVITAVRIKE